MLYLNIEIFILRIYSPKVATKRQPPVIERIFLNTCKKKKRKERSKIHDASGFSWKDVHLACFSACFRTGFKLHSRHNIIKTGSDSSTAKH